MFSNIKDIFSSDCEVSWPAIVMRSLCWLGIFSFVEYFLSAARLRAAADGREQVQAAARGQEQQEQEER